MEKQWLKEALFSGMTAKAFKLGTVLSLGWFWQRPNGCLVLYRGTSMEQVDFENIIIVANADANHVQPPSYITHSSDTVYFYIVRKVNVCGDSEKTQSSAVKVAINSGGDLAALQPNKTFKAKAKQIAGNKIEVIWFYCPLEQKSIPTCFQIYTDDGGGQIDYENPIDEIDYVDRGFYFWQSDALQVGRYLFALRTKDCDGVDDGSFAKLTIDIDDISPPAVDILDVAVI